MLQTPFYDFHRENNARFVDFAGWQMPIMYSSIHDEHRQTRSSGGLFDVSHMGRLSLTGRHARRFLERMLTRRISDMKVNTCRYSLICNEQGGVLDDVIIYRFDDRWLLVVNAANREKIVGHLQAHIGDLVVKLTDQTMTTAMVATQGPGVMDVIGRFSSQVPSLKRYGFCEKNLLVIKMIISRTGYTGEDGVEVIMGANMANMAIKLLLKDKASETGGVIRPAGLGARDTLRLEAGMCLYGHELDEQTDPLSAGLHFAVSLNKDEAERGEPFIGQAALKRIAAEGPPRRLVGLELEGKRTARQHMPVTQAGRPIGQITSGCISPTFEKPIAMAYLDRNANAEPGDAVQIDLAGKHVEAKLVNLPFYRRPNA